MASLKQLHELIHSLNKKEKIMLNLMIKSAAGKGRNRYLETLEIINNAKDFNDEKLRNKLGKQAKGMNQSEANTNLYNFICRSLLFLHEPPTGSLGLLKDLVLADIFIGKQLVSTAGDLLEHTVKTAEHTRNYQALHSALVSYQQLDVLIPAKQQNYNARIGLLDKRINYLQENMDYLGLRKLAIQFFALVKEIGSPRNTQQQEQYAALLNNSLLSNNNSVGNYPPLLKYEYYDLRSMILSACDRLADAYNECDNAIKSLETDFRKQKRFDSLQNLMLTKLTYSLEMEDTEKINQSRQQLIELKPHLTNKSRIITLSEKVFYATLFSLLKAGKYKEGIKVFEAHLTDPKLSEWQKSPLAYVDYLMGARLYFLSGDTDKALDYLIMIQDKEKVMRPSLLIAYKFLWLMCLYRKKDYVYLANSTSALYKMLYKMERIHEPERALIKFLKYAGNKDKWQAGMQKLHTTFTTLHKDPFNKAFFAYADYDKWLSTEMKKKRL